MTPVCLIEGGVEGLRVTDAGISLLESLNEPVAIVCLAGQYRTGKSFFLNQLASRPDDLPWINSSEASAVANGNLSNGSASPNAGGFRVGPTTESCTRGIWLWAPQPPVRNPAGQLVLFLDTEGMASTDNDESYDAKIFSLGLLLSSLFVFNTMGVIDEGAIDRLYLVSELTKHVCVSAHTSTAPASNNGFGGSATSQEVLTLSGDKLEESRALSPHFPPFVWLLRDFLLDMQIDGNDLTANQYLEKALDARDVSTTASESTKMRQIERNRTRASIRVLFGRRECLTLVRPVTDERDLRRAAELSDVKLRPEFVEQMSAVRRRLLSSVAAKELLGKTLNGPQVAQLVQCYTDTMNSGAVPDIKAAWEYVSDATCQAALAAAIELYDNLMEATSGKKPPKKVNDEGDSEDTDEVEEDTDDGGSEEVESGPKILSQAEFEAIYKDAQEQALTLFKVRSVEEALKQVLREGAWDAAANKEEAFQATMEVLEEVYERKARGPAKKKAFYQFLRVDSLEFFEALFQRVVNSQAQEKAEWNHTREQLEQKHANEEMEWKQHLQEKSMEVQQLLETKSHLEDKVSSQAERMSELQHASQQQVTAIADLENDRKSLNHKIEQLHGLAAELTKELEKTQLRLQHKEEALVKVEAEAQSTKQELTKQVEALRTTHQGEKEDWIRRAADQTAERTMLQKQIKKAELNAQQQERERELLDKERQQLQQLYESEVEARAQLARDYEVLRGDNDELERKLKQSAAQQLNLTQVAQREQARLESRLSRFQIQLGRLEGDREVEEVLRDCVSDVVRQADEDKIITLQEERRMLQEQLGDLHEKISTLPDFYVRQIFCAPEPVSSFFDALTSVVGDPSKW
ncbi:hypothetical protein PC129_g3122 [Phytophthora cactorum]|uniref:GB1/RHD3-type G domain-containing protein n=1 Tax=Phytophthora cactorum TaxID=29920 RepID=A0A8T1IPT9_9STRA|nr:hypothetical protein Pcac1_g22350 [Phytophthora cactorum]KAG2836628.1 hypothetical protein PC112_g5220 [Phytophthora cactorum]KAG2839417.1 hypothetical protein PC111_g3868 [Phytophthora cactorum]KAG2925562.1 hypothetical protein PC114_g4036 [Phytophthora cactorum]KAG2938954.1 hypothetical protein PC115_g3436 [Phytophthora cactorum]